MCHAHCTAAPNNNLSCTKWHCAADLVNNSIHALYIAGAVLWMKWHAHHASTVLSVWHVTQGRQRRYRGKAERQILITHTHTHTHAHTHTYMHTHTHPCVQTVLPLYSWWGADASSLYGPLLLPQSGWCFLYPSVTNNNVVKKIFDHSHIFNTQACLSSVVKLFSLATTLWLE